jgi:hypothetical protein
MRGWSCEALIASGRTAEKGVGDLVSEAQQEIGAKTPA